MAAWDWPSFRAADCGPDLNYFSFWSRGETSGELVWVPKVTVSQSPMSVRVIRYRGERMASPAMSVSKFRALATVRGRGELVALPERWFNFRKPEPRAAGARAAVADRMI